MKFISKLLEICYSKINVFRFIVSQFLCFQNINICEAEDRKMTQIAKIKSPTPWIWISYQSKNMKGKFGKSYQLFYFQVRESPAPLNIPIPTPASDRGGPVACIGGPETCIFYFDHETTRSAFWDNQRLRDHSIRQRGHSGLMQEWGSECWGVLGIPSFENRQVGWFYNIYVSCFWSKLN